MSRPSPPTYKTRHWPAYNEALKRVGSLTIWFDPAMVWDATPTGKHGRPPDYSDTVIQTCLAMKVPFGMALRQIATSQDRTAVTGDLSELQPVDHLESFDDLAEMEKAAKDGGPILSEVIVDMRTEREPETSETGRLSHLWW